MIIYINKNTTKEEIDKKLASIKTKKVNLKKYVGVLKGSIDGLEYQKKIRSEYRVGTLYYHKVAHSGARISKLKKIFQ